MRRHSAPLLNRGFSLLEVLLALAIFAAAIIGITESVVTQIRAEKLAEDTSRGVILAQNIMEEIRYGGNFTEEKKDGQFDGENAGINWEYEVSKGDIDGLYKVRVAVTWSDGLAQKKYETETLMAERGKEEKITH